MGVLDAAGNFSGWTELEPLDFSGCGCTSEPRGSSWWAGLLVLAAPRRRARR